MFGVKFVLIILLTNSVYAFEFSRKGLDDIFQNIKDPFHYYEDYCPKSQNTDVNQVMCMAESNVITPKPDAIEQIGLSSEELEEWIWIKESADRRANETKALFVKQGKIKAGLKDRKAKENKELRSALNLAIQAEAAITLAKNCDSFMANNKTCNQFPRSEWKKRLENAQKAKALILAEEPLLLHKDLDLLIRKNGNLTAFPMDGYQGYDTYSSEFTNALEIAVSDREKYYKELWDKYDILNKNELKMGELVNTSRQESSRFKEDYKDLVKATINDKSILIDLTQSDPFKFSKSADQDPLIFAKCRIENRVLKKESQKDSAMFAANAFLAMTPLGMSSIAVRASTTLARLAPLSTTVALGASDMAALKSQENECKQLQNRVVNEGNANKAEEYQDCVDTYKNQWFMTLLGVGAGAKGATKLVKNAMPSEVVSEAGQIKSGLTKEMNEQFKAMKGDRGGYTPIAQETYDILASTPVDQKLEIEFTGLSKGYKTKHMSPRELSDLAKQDPSLEFQIKSIPTEAKSVELPSNLANKFEDHWLTTRQWDPGHKFEKTVILKSGEAVEFSGNAERFAELAKNPNVVTIKDAAPNPWYRRLSEVPEKEQGSKFNAYLARSDELKSDLSKMTYYTKDASSGLSGAKIYHGTLDVYEDSVKAGPKNVGTGFGGRGLYVAFEEDKQLAANFAEKAKKEAADRISQVNSDGIIVKKVNPNQVKSVVLEGSLNPNKNLKVARFRVDRYTEEPDFKKGVLPTNWHEDPVLRKILEEQYDAIELTQMDKSGLALDFYGKTKRILIIHERAGPDAIVWNKVERF